MPVPEVRFSFQSDGGTLTVLPRQTLVERVSDVFGDVVPVHALHEIRGSGEGFTITVVAAQPEIVRRDRRYIRTYVNGRRVWEYQLSQAVEYAYQDVQHGGLYPAAALFIDIEPELIDFNIHPAKREVRIRPSGEVHHRIVEILRSFLRAYTVRTVQFDREFGESSFGSPTAPRRARENTRRGYSEYSLPRETPERFVGERPPFEHRVRAVPDGPRLQEESDPRVSETRTDLTDPRSPVSSPDASERPGPIGSSDATNASEPEEADRARARSAAAAADLLYRGTIFETYVIVEWEDRAYLIDQHAAHERLLYDHYRSHRATQRFLVPEEFSVTEDQDAALQRHREEFRAIGIEIERPAPGVWRLIGAPPEYREQTETIIDTILELRGLQEELDRVFLAELACKAAVKGGDFVDDLTALDLARRTLSLETPRCPHGRPLWVELTRDRLERLIGRR
jgi:DNA mismatch repair protein MutL